MPSPSLLQLLGSRGDKEPRYAPIFTDRFFVGLWTNRNPLRSPLSTFYADGWHLGGTDALIGGVNIELSPRLTLCRRTGNLIYSTATIPTPPLTFYPFILFGSTAAVIDLIVDTASQIYVLTPTSLTSIFTKGTGAGQANFLGIGQTLYFGDGVEVEAWQNGIIRNWGINIGLFGGGIGPTLAGTGADDGSGFAAWTTPSNVTTTGVSYAVLNSFLASHHSSDGLLATNYAFGVATGKVVAGASATFTGFNTGGAVTLSVSLTYGGTTIGTPKSITLPVTAGTVTVGGSSDLWGATLTPALVNSASFGLIFNVLNPGHTAVTPNVNINNVKLQLYGTGGPVVTLVGSGTFVAYTGYEYVVAYGNSASGQVSSATPPSANTGPFGAAISTSTVAAAGLNYAVSDTGIIAGGSFTATYIVNTVSGTGAVLTYTITSAGSNFAVANNVPTAVGGAQPGVGTGFTINVTAITGISYVGVGVIASTDPQVNQIWVFRTADGGSTFLNLPNSPFPNTTQTIHDSAPDSALNILEQAPINSANNPPPAGSLDPVLYLGLIWVHVGNAVYFARSGSAIVGTQYESFPPANVFTFPQNVVRKIPTNAGLLILTTSDIYIIVGQNTAASILISQPFLAGYGILSWNSVWIDGSIIYFFTSDKRMIRLDPSAGVEDMGFPIGDQLATFNPGNVYTTYLSSTSNDTALYIGDGSTGWFRCNPNQAPDGQITGPVWSPKANIVGGCGALVAVQTSPGVHQLMMGGPGNNENVLVRDSSYATFTDGGTAYPSNCQIGCVVLAQPGQVAIMRFIAGHFKRIGTSPIVSVLMGEISGTFESISGYVVNDPPYLAASASVYNERYYFKQSVGGAPPEPALCEYLQIQIDYGNEDTVQNELLSLTINGAHFSEK